MAQERADKLFFTGEFDANGQPLTYFAAVPARDLDESDIAALTDDQYRDVTASKLYQKSKPSGREAEAPAVKAEPAAEKKGG